jgi:ribosomal protein L11 methyltransferase
VKIWFAIDVVGDVAAQEAIEYGLMEAGSLGTETVTDAEVTRVTGYFDLPQNASDIEHELSEALRVYDLSKSSLHKVNAREIENRDWMEEWKKSWRPVQVGRFMIAPPWLVSEPGAVATGSSECVDDPVPVSSSDTIVIAINPGMAFGTGTHETTRLCLKAIEKHYRGGSFLDVGTGTGILAIAAAKCQKPDTGVPSRAARLGWGGQGGRPLITGCDTDADAIQIAKENAGLNRVAELIDFRVGSVDAQTQSADLVCANLTAPVIVELLPALIGATCGRLILSGILDSQIEMVRTGLLDLGVVDFEIDQDGEWVAVVV